MKACVTNTTITFKVERHLDGMANDHIAVGSNPYDKGKFLKFTNYNYVYKYRLKAGNSYYCSVLFFL